MSTATKKWAEAIKYLDVTLTELGVCLARLEAARLNIKEAKIELAREDNANTTIQKQ